ncbi:MAG: DUF1343 domain-containing protein [Flavobacteriaceae bacterium]|nr:DUF1343 domain-containing protein [Flavobacteriaceae bacterium]MCY4266957.1 DUF1343 domain-containing protein [Flavobacteriaceae bacterium]
MSFFKITLLLFLSLVACATQKEGAHSLPIKPGAENLGFYLQDIKDREVGLVANQSSIINHDGDFVHLVDTLQTLGVSLVRVFAPEHGFRGIADAGEKIENQIDSKSGLPIYSLYGQNYKPSTESLEGIEVMLFDLQDVGARFYTYLSTLHYVMEACAENQIPLIVLDRPNPNIHLVDGPVLDLMHSSFVGMHPVPISYGMTIGEYAQMINGQRWLNNEIQTDLTIVPIKHYTRSSEYAPPIKPSPNLPNLQSIYLYPSLCLLEPTVISVGRGTSQQFQVFGHPQLWIRDYSFTPEPNLGAKNPKHKGQLCFGKDLSDFPKPSRIELEWLVDAYAYFPNKEAFFLSGFNRIAGNELLQIQIKNGYNAEQIRNSWKKDLEAFEKIRSLYLIYPDN